MDCEVLVIGAGFGGLAAALTLAEAGVRVLLCEALRYPGGCASTFTRNGQAFEAGATLFSGFGEGQLFQRWIARHRMPVQIQWLDPILELRAPGWTLPVSPRREELIQRLCDEPGAPKEGLREFFRRQGEVADLLWSLFDSPAGLPPFGARELWRHLLRSPRYLRLLPLVGQPLGRVVAEAGLADFEPLRRYLDAVCQITLQASGREAEAPFAMAAMDYYFRGTGHVQGGIGRLAGSMVEAIRALGGEVRLAERVRRLEPIRVAGKAAWNVELRSGKIRAPLVVANLLPQSVERLAQPSPALRRLAARVEEGWGAAMLYLTLDSARLERPGAMHLELIADPALPLQEGNHLFCSLGEGMPHRTATVSTHVPLQRFLELDAEAQGRRVQEIQERMRATLGRLAPELESAVVSCMTASPRTFERFTRRFQGYVGGIPRRAGLQNYWPLWPSPVLPNLYLVGDSVFPGQSVLATAIGGVKLGQRLIGRLR